jgi:uncharacterized alpha-E superfamily protein
MMLSRIADSLYWMGRYIERAENIARLLRVTTDFAVELAGLNDGLAIQEWELLFGPPPMLTDPPPGATLSYRYIHSFFYDENNTRSVMYSLEQARNNARMIGEVLTREVISHLNETYHKMNAQQKIVQKNPARALDYLNDTHTDILTTLGAIEHTLTRDQGWTYMKLGETMERTQKTLQVIDIKLPSLRQSRKDADSTLYFAACRSLLLDLASLENYRRVFGARMEPELALRFLLFDDQAPRTVHSGIKRMKGYFDGLPAGSQGVVSARRILGRLYAEVQYDEEVIMGLNDISTYTRKVYERLSKAHDVLCHPNAEVESA